MSVPTVADNPANVYATLPTGLGLAVGMEFEDSVSLRRYKLVQADASSIPINGAVYYSTITGTKGAVTALKVTATSTANTQQVAGVADAPGVIVTTGQYFWLTIQGFCTPLVATTIAAGATICSSATSGTLGAFTAGTSIQSNIYTLASSGSGGATSCFIA